LLTVARTNWNFEFARTAKYLIQNLQTVWKKCQRLLSTFANVCYFYHNKRVY